MTDVIRNSKSADLLARMRHWIDHPRLSSGMELMRELQTKLERLQAIAEYLDDPAVLLNIPQPYRMRISELLHGE